MMKTTKRMMKKGNPKMQKMTKRRTRMKMKTFNRYYNSVLVLNIMTAS